MNDGSDYQLWQADLWECPDCGNQVILGYGAQCWSAHWQSDFKSHLDKVDFTINGKIKALSCEHCDDGVIAIQVPGYDGEADVDFVNCEYCNDS